MKAIISSTYDDLYLFFLPIVTFCWNKLGVDVICFMPTTNDRINTVKYLTVLDCMRYQAMSYTGYLLDSPKDKEATYAQCSRLFGTGLMNSNEQFVISDIDMIFFGKDYFNETAEGIIDIYGSDLVPEKQFPMCYVVGEARSFSKAMGSWNKGYQECLDDLLGGIEAEHFRGNYWGKDQETLFNRIIESEDIDFRLHKRAKEGTQFATNRLDRDDAYILERDIMGAIDFHMPRPGFEDKNFDIIFEILSKRYPEENLDWMIAYKNEYKKLL